MSYFIELLGKQRNKQDFSCGIEALDRYFSHQSGQEARRHVAVTFVLVDDTSKTIAGFYTLSSTSIEAGELPHELANKLPKYPILPATLLARLAVDKRCQGKKLGELLLVDAMKRSLKVSYEIGSIAMVVDAKDENAIAFYKKYGFIQFTAYSNKLFLPMAMIKNIWEK